MAEHSLGVVVPNGLGPVRATANCTDPTAPVWAHSYRVQHWPGNTGKGYVGDSTMEFGSGTGVFGYLPEPPVPPAATLWPMYQSPPAEIAMTHPFDMSQVYCDTELAADGLLITYMDL